MCANGDVPVCARGAFASGEQHMRVTTTRGRYWLDTTDRCGATEEEEEDFRTPNQSTAI